jgi:Zn-dependent protease with chaperone function
MNKSKLLISVFVVATAVGAITYYHTHLLHQLRLYVSQRTEQELGAKPLAPAQEAAIKQIAYEMDITIPINIRKMNPKALLTFGYHNAFACFPLLFNCIPVGNTPYLFVSEGFFEDLPQHEQRFIIGHEMIHIREQHTLYLNLVVYFLFLLLLAASYFLAGTINILVQRYTHTKYHVFFLTLIKFLLFVICLAVPNLTALAYRRHIERVADCESLKILNSFEGCTDLIDRWQKEFKLSPDNPYFGFFSDHPSCSERKTYCLELQNKPKEIL